MPPPRWISCFETHVNHLQKWDFWIHHRRSAEKEPNRAKQLYIGLTGSRAVTNRYTSEAQSPTPGTSHFGIGWDILEGRDEGNELCIKICIYVDCYRLYFLKTVAIFSATYTLQQLGRRSLRNKQKNEKTSYRIRLVTSVSLLSTLPCTAQLPVLQQYTCIWNTSFVPHHFKYKADSDTGEILGLGFGSFFLCLVVFLFLLLRVAACLCVFFWPYNFVFTEPFLLKN
jgi:hypothetical protein